MKLNMYERTPKGTTPKWIKISLIVTWALFTAVFALISVVLAIENLATGLIVLVPILLCYFGLAVTFYNWRRAYMEIEGDTIYITDYPFFKERKKTVSLHDIQKIKEYRVSGRGVTYTYLIFINQKNKTLLKTYDLPEIRAHFAELGFEVE